MTRFVMIFTSEQKGRSYVAVVAYNGNQKYISILSVRWKTLLCASICCFMKYSQYGLLAGPGGKAAQRRQVVRSKI